MVGMGGARRARIQGASKGLGAVLLAFGLAANATGLAATSETSTSDPSPPRIAEFLPQGTATGVEAVQLRFESGVVPFGDPDIAAPLHLACEGPVPAGQGRWLDEQRWTYVFESVVPAGVHCRADPNPDFRSREGAAISSDVHFEFNTGAPTLELSRPYPGWDIDEEQVFILRFDGPVDAAVVAEHSHCAVQGIGERIPVKALSADLLPELLEAAYISEAEDPARMALLQCARSLPPESDVRLNIGPGIQAEGQASRVPASQRAEVLKYQVRSPFMAKLTCTRERAGRPCLPLTPITVTFSAPVERSALDGIALTSGETRFEATPASEEDSFVYGVTFPGPFPSASKLTLTLPEGLQDDAGRTLANADRYPMEIQVGDYPPLAKFASGTFGVIERFTHGSPSDEHPEGAAVPVTLRHLGSDANLKGIVKTPGEVTGLHSIDDGEVWRWYQTLRLMENRQWTRAQIQRIATGQQPGSPGRDKTWIDTRSVSLLSDQESVRRLILPDVDEDGRSLEVVGIPVKEPGFHVLELESPRLGASLLEAPGPMYVRTAVLLTNLSLHAKIGRDDLMVWATTLADARPVEAAEITVLDCNGRTVARGRSDAQGVWHHRSALDAPDYCSETGMSGLFISARIAADHPQAHGAADYTFVLSDWDSGIESWRFNVPTATGREPDVVAHTVFDRALFRAGETVSMKHYFRTSDRDGLHVPPTGRPDRVVIQHQGSSQQYEMALEWEETPGGGLVALNEFALPESAYLGTYSVRLTDRDHGWYGDQKFRVEEFRLPVMTGQISVDDIQQGVLVAPEAMDVDVQLSWMTGGPAAGQKVALSAVATERPPVIEGHDAYSFRAPPRELHTSTADQNFYSEESAAGPWRELFLDDHQAVLDANGTARVRVDRLPRIDAPARFQLEMSYADPSGEIQTLSQSVDVWPSTIQAGIRTTSWDRAGREIPVGLIALGMDSQPRAGVPMQLLAVERKTWSVRKRMVGGFYRYDSHTERVPMGTVCEGETDASGKLECTVSFDRAGSFELIAVAKDEEGRSSKAYSSLWLSAAGELWFAGQDDDRIDIIPARQEWKAGELAEFQVRMPFREATALVTVEREGVLWSELQTLRGTDPVVKIPVAPDWGPNAYVSVLVLRGRIYDVPWRSFFDWGWRRPADWIKAYGEDPDALVTSQIDLAKPAFRMGLAELRVQDEINRLKVEVLPETDVLKVRTDTSARVRVTLPDGTPAAHGAVAFAMVDDALLELAPNDSWKLYEAMYPRRSLGVRTATSQMQVVGRRHYGRKAVAAGGGGGIMPTRQLLDTLVSWQPMVPLDANGEAVVRFRTNDALSRFRLVALADHGARHFGSGSTSVVTRQDVQIISGLPPVVREGDAYQATITVRNGTDEDREISVAAQMKGVVASANLPEQSVKLGPGEARQVSWQVEAPQVPWPDESASVEWTFTAQDDAVSDKLAQTQRLVPRQATKTVQATLLSVLAGQSESVAVAPPANAATGPGGDIYGGLSLDVGSSLIGSLEGVRDWWRAYPYTCLEQTASQAIALLDSSRWERVLRKIPTHMDEDGLLRYFPGTRAGSEVLTAYLVSVADDAARLSGDDYRLPMDVLAPMLDGLQAFAEGRITRNSRLGDVGLDSRRLMAMEALSRHGRLDPALLTSLKGRPESWPTPTVVDWLATLRRLPPSERRAEQINSARSLLISRMLSSGGAMAFTEAARNSAPTLMATRTTSLARLMLTVMDDPAWQEDLPRMAQGLIATQVNGRWQITTENLLGLLALADFSRQFEKVPAEGAVSAAMGRAAPVSISLPPKGETSTTRLPWGESAAELALQHEGHGRAWIGVRAEARVPVTEPSAAGFRVERRIVPVQRSRPDAWTHGDVYRVELEIHARDGSNWVVLDDPIPAGATILGSGLGRDSEIRSQTEQMADYPPAFVERSSTAYRAYYDYMPAGRVTLAYTVRLNTVGDFTLPPTRVEALYRPDLHGSFPNNEGMRVGPDPRGDGIMKPGEGQPN